MTPRELSLSHFAERVENVSNGKARAACSPSDVNIFLEKNHEATKCSHSEKQRSLFGTWPTPELHLAVQNGYRVLRYHEIWAYDDVGPSLFKEFLMSLKRLKFINSGFPSNVPEEQRQEWLDMMIEKEVCFAEWNCFKCNPNMPLRVLTMWTSLKLKAIQSSAKSQSGFLTLPTEN